MYPSTRLLLCLPGLLFAVPALAQDDGEAPPCTPEVAEVASVEQLAANFREWAGRCVRVRGLHAFGKYLSEHRLYADREAVLVQDDPSPRAITINYHNDVEHERHRPRWEELVGRFHSCALAYEWADQYHRDNPGEIIMLGGLCHYTMAHYIVPERYREIDGGPVTRLLRSEVPAELLDFEAIDVTGQADNPRRQTLELLLAALHDEDLEAYLQLAGRTLLERISETNDLFNLDLQDVRELGEVAGHFEDVAAIWHEFRQHRDPRVFWLRERIEEDSEHDGVVTYLAGVDPGSSQFFCFLRSGRTQADLPVRWADIDNDPARPYFCVETGEFVVFQGENHAYADAPLSLHGFAEPEVR